MTEEKKPKTGVELAAEASAAREGPKPRRPWQNTPEQGWTERAREARAAAAKAREASAHKGKSPLRGGRSY